MATDPTLYPEDDEVLFRKLRTRPKVAWPTVVLMLACHSAFICIWVAGLTAETPHWWLLAGGCLVNGLAMYFLFSPIHDAMHQSVFQKKWQNNAFLFVSVLPIIPFSTSQFLRMMHMQHHRFANGEHDPDHELSKNLWNMYFWWGIWQFSYIGFYNRHKAHYPPFSTSLLRHDLWIAWVTIIPMAIYFPLQTLFLWFIPTLMMSWLICVVFMHLPHRPHQIEQQDDPYRATLIREGWEWLLNPLTAYQNYHLVHHLYPTVPFYRYRKVWDARKQFHMAQNPAIVKPWQLDPKAGPSK